MTAVEVLLVYTIVYSRYLAQMLTRTRSGRKVSSHFEYLENRLRGHDGT
jgi:hypothetical protein